MYNVYRLVQLIELGEDVLKPTKRANVLKPEVYSCSELETLFEGHHQSIPSEQEPNQIRHVLSVHMLLTKCYLLL